MIVRRDRRIYFLLIIITALSGLGSRKFPDSLPAFFAEYSGDTLWALLVFLLAGFIFSSRSTLFTGIIALTFSFVVEFTQLYHSGWIDNIRHTIAGGLILGYGFLWSDLICYFAGVMLGMLLEKFLLKIFII